MAEQDILMSKKDLKRTHIIRCVLGNHFTQGEAGELLGLSRRQIRRLVKRFKKKGEKGIIHRLKGYPSNRAYDEEMKKKVLGLYEDKYWDFGPLLASEKLLEIDKIRINDETLRLWLIKANIWQGRRKGRKHRKWRERKHWFGAMVQMDGSHHDWLEGRGPALVLIGYIDDATGEVYARFYLYEGTIPAMDSFKRYVKKYGIPQCVYFDKHTTYKSPKKPSIEDELMNQEAVTQFGRALKELGVDFINAHSPQAKGRIERLFRTFQDRLIKEMRLRGIRTMEEANRFLEYYLPVFNKRYGVKAIEEGDLHRPVPKGMDLDRILCKKAEHALRNDYTVMHERKVYQVLEKTKALRVTVEERVNGKLYITYNGEQLRYREIPRQLYSPPRQHQHKQVKQTIAEKPRRSYKPPKKHPWRQFVINPYKKRYSQKEKEAKRKSPMKLWKLMDNSTSSPQFPQYYDY